MPDLEVRELGAGDVPAAAAVLGRGIVIQPIFLAAVNLLYPGAQHG